MKKVTALLLAMALCLAALAGCSQSAPQGSDAPPSQPSQGAGSSAAPKEPVTVTVWHDGDQGIMQTIADQVNAQLADDQITVAFEKKTDMPNQLKLYGSDAANAPDLYFYAHDVLGTFVAMDILAPLSDVVDTSILADHLPMTVEAGQIGGTQYLLPVYFETLVFLYNKALWEGASPPPPRSCTTTWRPIPTPQPAPTPWSTSTPTPITSPPSSTALAAMSSTRTASLG